MLPPYNLFLTEATVCWELQSRNVKIVKKYINCRHFLENHWAISQPDKFLDSKSRVIRISGSRDIPFTNSYERLRISITHVCIMGMLNIMIIHCISGVSLGCWWIYIIAKWTGLQNPPVIKYSRNHFCRVKQNLWQMWEHYHTWLPWTEHWEGLRGGCPFATQQVWYIEPMFA